MTAHFTLTREGERYTAEFKGCKESADTPIEAIERVHRAAAVQKAFERNEGFLEPIEEIEKELPF
jgi:predicted RNase H-like HicB family nuclease